MISVANYTYISGTSPSSQGVALNLEQLAFPLSPVRQNSRNSVIFVNSKKVDMIAADDHRAIFDNYYRKWEEDTAIMSRGDEIFSNPNYLAIVAMGKDAIPFIKEKIRKHPDPIVNALYEITGDTIKDRTLTFRHKGFTSLSRACKLWLRQLKN